ncbi:MAG: hypothetical protein KKA10_17770 [Euryarchaeota archaeon]|nr:hypothetical protein [Euryarchaeota archaeon]MCG2734826.1 hypothetical protein [Candidatus Methanoperedenaceae archaeon]
MIPELKLFETFVELFNINASLIIIILCAHVLLKTSKLDRGLLKARIFLNNAVLQQIWISISIAGAAFALNALLKLVGLHLIIKDIISDFYLIELTQMIFLISFIYAVFVWYLFITKPAQTDSSSG